MHRWISRKNIVTALAIVLLAAVLLLSLTRLPRTYSPDEQATLAISEMKSAGTGLAKSLTKYQSSDKATKEYLALLTQMHQGCQDVNKAKASADRIAHQNVNHDTSQVEITVGTFTRLGDSLKLCNDLDKVVLQSQKIYTTIRPLMVASTQPKRWQTIPPIKDNLRAKQLRQAEASQKALKQPVSQMQYPTIALNQLEQLQTAIKHSHGLTYMTNLRMFQDQMLAERSRFWTDYIDLSNLNHNLDLQLQRYCGNLHGSKPQECKT
jgi:Sec-independent protein translocase protein TatA